MSDSSYHNALPILLTPHQQIQFFLVGCGGTGGFLAPMLARLIVSSRTKVNDTVLTFVKLLRSLPAA
ncbi:MULTISPECIES: hypothetical protein [Aerosakkonema]|uniref:hypothetical protein n=1 Tax=Aerosakkonema TaxID=1246629 RepID=UPI0035BBBCA1